ncbi:MAG: ABC transporter substrate-binding protein [Atopobiaceae bacterium]|nr:ABC transporter substrate-binding protein [Atopobiaceae bacterium]MCI2172955.1 ABC transporter substrate-binding protein [Atopobiaceae bacterium]MCI2208360.1 ABC transporter substrate-binding protein [Atopobiaceae bacterium]
MQNNKGMTRRAFLGLAGSTAVLAGLGLSGCGGSSASSTTSSTTTSSEAKGGGTLTAAVAYETKNYHPSTTSSALALGANWHVVEGLYEFDMHTMETYDALASGDPTKVSDTEYTIAMRSGAKFSDGTDVTADDVVSSFKRSTAEGSLYTSMLAFISDMTAKDSSTVDLQLAYAMDPTLIKKRLCIVKVVPTSATDDALTSKPVGSGPWMYDSIDEKTIVFKPNTNYNGSVSVKDNEMDWSIIKDDTARTTAMNEGTVMVMESVPADVADQIKSAGAEVDEVQGFNLPFLMFNTKKAPFDNYQVRQAFFYAIDMDKLISNAMSGKATAASCFLPETHTNYHKAATVFTYDTAKAKQLIDDAGASGTQVELITTDHTWITALAPQIKNDLEAIGLSVTINSMASSSLYSNYTDVDAPDFDVALAPGDPSVFGDDPDLLMNWWYGDNTWTKKRTQWKDSDKYTELHGYMQKAVESTGTEQQDNWNQCFDLLAEQVPLYPLFHRIVATGYYADKISNFAGIGTTGVDLVGCVSK